MGCTFMKEKIIELLKNNDGDFISGQKISESFGVSRAAIWKYINALKEEGYKIESVSKKGYRLVSSPDILTYEEIKDKLTTKYIGRTLYHYDTIDSTNIKAKDLASKGVKDGTIVISEEQTMGKGRLGRSWASPKYKGIWMSIILKPNIKPEKLARVTQIGAAAVTKAVRNMGIEAFIKWPNDIVIGNKKVCGILTEMNCELNRINYLVVGIGINVNLEMKDITEEISNIATSLLIESGNKVDRKKLVADILNIFEEMYQDFIKTGYLGKALDICRKYSILIGKEVRIIDGNKEMKAKVLGLSDEGELLVDFGDGKEKKLISGEVSVRGLYGYT